MVHVVGAEFSVWRWWGRSSVEAWFSTALDIEECLAGGVDAEVRLFVADVIKCFDTVDRGLLDQVLSSLGLPAWFRHVNFEYHAQSSYGSSLRLTLVSLWPGMEAFLKGAL